jgi:multiple antibiotic resistance protein
MKYNLSIAVTLFFIMDPLGNIPVFLSVLKRVAPERRNKILVRELLIALGFLLLFFFVGQYGLRILHLSNEAIGIGGGLVLFLIAVHMIFPSDKATTDENMSGEPFIVPLAVPLVAGPSTLAVILLLDHSNVVGSLFAIIVAWVGSSIILLFSTSFYKILGERGLIAVERLTGMLLIIMSVQMFLDGIASYFKGG